MYFCMIDKIYSLVLILYRKIEFKRNEREIEKKYKNKVEFLKYIYASAGND